MIQIEPEQFLDPRWRLSNLYTITDKAGTRVPFRPNSAQLALLDDLHSANIILKARQLGFTTLCCLIYLDACIFTPNTRAGVIAHKLDDAKVIFRDKIKYPYDQLDEGLKAAAPAVQDSADTLTFANNSSIRVSTSMRSGTLQYLHVSEFGKICAQYPEKAREIVTGALNTVEAGQFIVIESTAEGQEGAFYRMCQEARENAAMGKSCRRSTGSSTSSPGGRTAPIRSTKPRSRSARSTSATSSGWRPSTASSSPPARRPGTSRRTRRSEATCGGNTPRPPTRPSSRRWRAPTSPTSSQRPPSRAASAASRSTPQAGQHLLGPRPQRPERHLAASMDRRLPPLRRLLREQRRVHRPLCLLAEGMGARARRRVRRPLRAA